MASRPSVAPLASVLVSEFARAVREDCAGRDEPGHSSSAPHCPDSCRTTTKTRLSKHVRVCTTRRAAQRIARRITRTTIPMATDAAHHAESDASGRMIGHGDRSEAAERVRGIGDVEVDIAETDVELEMPVGVFLGQLGFGPRRASASRRPRSESAARAPGRCTRAPYGAGTRAGGAGGSFRSSCSDAGRRACRRGRSTLVSSGFSSTAQRFARVSSRGPIPASVIGCRQSSMAREDVGSSASVPASSLFKPDVVSQHLAAVAAGDVDRLATLGGLLELEVDALRLGSHLHRHDVQRGHPPGDPFTLVERAGVIFDSHRIGPDSRRSSRMRSLDRCRSGVAAMAPASATCRRGRSRPDRRARLVDRGDPVRSFDGPMPGRSTVRPSTLVGFTELARSWRRRSSPARIGAARLATSDSMTHRRHADLPVSDRRDLQPRRSDLHGKLASRSRTRPSVENTHTADQRRSCAPSRRVRSGPLPRTIDRISRRSRSARGCDADGDKSPSSESGAHLKCRMISVARNSQANDRSTPTFFEILVVTTYPIDITRRESSLARRCRRVSFSRGCKKRDRPAAVRGANRGWTWQPSRSVTTVAEYTIESVESSRSRRSRTSSGDRAGSDAVVIDPGFDTAVDPRAYLTRHELQPGGDPEHARPCRSHRGQSRR